MPTEVRCVCGNVFTVDDEFAGGRVNCQACGSAVVVPIEPAGPVRYFEAPPLGPSPPPPPPPPHAVRRPLRGESPKDRLTPEQEAILLGEIVDALDEHMKNPGNIADDRELAGGLLSARSYVAITLTVLGVLMLILAATMGRDGGIVGVPGFLLALVAAPFALAMAVRDCQAAHIGSAKKPVRAFKRYFMALKSRRWRKAYAALAPSARIVEKTEPVTFEKIQYDGTTYSITDPKSLRKYWCDFFGGPKGQMRNVYLKRVRPLSVTGDGLALVELDFEFSSYSAWLQWWALLGVIPAIIIIGSATTKEKKTIRKLLVRRREKWYVADAQLEGALDRIALREE